MAHSMLIIGDLNNPLYTFEDSDFISVSGSVSVDLMADDMVVDTMEHSVNYDKVSENSIAFSPSDFDAIYDNEYEIVATNYQGTKDLSITPYGTTVYYYYDSVLIGKFYTQKIARTGKNKYEITLMSCIGLLSNLTDNGGIYTINGGDTFRSVLASILGGSVGTLSDGMYPITGGVFDCFVEQQAGNLPIAGWLPISTKRENLHQLCFAESVSLTKSADGTPVFAFLYSQDNPETLSDANIYINGAINYGDPATAVNVTEHQYLNLGTLDEEVTLFDNSTSIAVVNTKVEFSNPCHDLTVSGLTVSSSGVNYAVVSGNGTLKGRKYTHATNVLRREIVDPSGEINEVNISGVTLVNTTNSANVADRAMDYYSKAKTVDADARISEGNPKAGREYSFTDPFGESASGFVTNIEFESSNILKGRCHIITDYKPTGQGNNFSQAVLMTSGNWTVPSGITNVRAILIGGGQGGTAGTNGSNGNRCTPTDYEGGYYTGIDTTTATGGDGGTAGTPGDGGKVLTVDITGLSAGNTLSITYGQGGASGGSLGGNTTLTANGTTYSSANGQVNNSGIINLFNGQLYGKRGLTGYDGAGGGTFNAQGGSLTVGGTTWQGGSVGGVSSKHESGYGLVTNEEWRQAGGGGAAYGHKGGDGTPTNETDYTCNGGNGASANAPSSASYGCGGNAGNGGGGGAGGGYSHFTAFSYPSLNVSSYSAGNAGTGGNGSRGSDGGRGCVLIYF